MDNRNRSDDFGAYKLLLLDKLETLNVNYRELYDFIKDHMDREEASILEIRERLTKIEQDRLWTSKLWASGISAAGVLFSLFCSYLIKK